MSFRPLSVWKGRFRRGRGAWGGNRRADEVAGRAGCGRRAGEKCPISGNRRTGELPPGGGRKLIAQGNPPECRMPLRKGKRRASEKVSDEREPEEQSIGQSGTAERAKNAGQTGNPRTVEIRLAVGNRRTAEIRRSAGRGGRGERLRVGMLRGRHVLLGHRLQKGRQIGARHMKHYFSAF